MPRAKFETGEAVEMRCLHRRDGQMALDWLAGRVVAASHRMLAVQFETEVFANTGQSISDRTLWCTHGSQNLRRPAGEHEPGEIAREVKSHEQ